MERLLTSSSDNVLLQSLLLTWSSMLTVSWWNVFTGLLRLLTGERVRAVTQSARMKCNSMVLRPAKALYNIPTDLSCPPCSLISEKLTC